MLDTVREVHTPEGVALRLPAAAAGASARLSGAEVLVVGAALTDLGVIRRVVTEGGGRLHAVRTPQAGLPLARDLDPDLLVLDLARAPDRGLALKARLDGDPLLFGKPVVALTCALGENQPKVSRHLAQLRSGGLLADRWLGMRKAVVFGGILLVLGHVGMAFEGQAAQRVAGLTPQQFRVLQMLGEGLLNKQIAFELKVSEATIKAHMTAILRKLGASNRTQAVLIAGKLAVDPDTDAIPPDAR